MGCQKGVEKRGVLFSCGQEFALVDHRRGARGPAAWTYLSVVAYALVSVVGFLSYAFRGIGKFTKPFFPWDVPDELYATGMLIGTGIYCVVGGMYSVVVNDPPVRPQSHRLSGRGHHRHHFGSTGTAHGRRSGRLGPTHLRLDAASRLVAPHATAHG
jgi:hypothetical protein